MLLEALIILDHPPSAPKKVCIPPSLAIMFAPRFALGCLLAAYGGACMLTLLPTGDDSAIDSEYLDIFSKHPSVSFPQPFCGLGASFAENVACPSVGTSCQGCPLRERCTKSTSGGRSVSGGVGSTPRPGPQGVCPSRVRAAHRCTALPSEPCMRLSPHTAQATRL